jgi:hypothetical protein
MYLGLAANRTDRAALGTRDARASGAGTDGGFYMRGMNGDGARIGKCSPQAMATEDRGCRGLFARGSERAASGLASHREFWSTIEGMNGDRE